jgi:hypothetical protein
MLPKASTQPAVDLLLNPQVAGSNPSGRPRNQVSTLSCSSCLLRRSTSIPRPTCDRRASRPHRRQSPGRHPETRNTPVATTPRSPGGYPVRLRRDRPEVLVSGEGLQRGPVDVLGTLLHEAAHGLAHAARSATPAVKAAATAAEAAMKGSDDSDQAVGGAEEGQQRVTSARERARLAKRRELAAISARSSGTSGQPRCRSGSVTRTAQRLPASMPSMRRCCWSWPFTSSRNGKSRYRSRINWSRCRSFRLWVGGEAIARMATVSLQHPDTRQRPLRVAIRQLVPAGGRPRAHCNQRWPAGTVEGPRPSAPGRRGDRRRAARRAVGGAADRRQLPGHDPWLHQLDLRGHVGNLLACRDDNHLSTIYTTWLHDLALPRAWRRHPGDPPWRPSPARRHPDVDSAFTRWPKGQSPLRI